MNHILSSELQTRPLRVGIGGPVGSGKTALVEALCKRLRDKYDIFVITNDIYTKEDQLILTRAEALPAERIMGVETGGCPHTAIREDASMNLAAIDEMNKKFPNAELCFVESGALRSPHYQQDRPSADGGGESWSHGSGHTQNAREAAFRVLEFEERRRG